VKDTIKRFPLLSFFVLAYAISWILLIPYVLAERGDLSGDYKVFYIIHTFGPAIAASAVTLAIAGKDGFRQFRQRKRQYRAPWPWYLFILVGIPALVVLGVLLQPGALAGFRGIPPSVLISYPIYLVIVFFGGGPLGEEPGWRGFALPRMQLRYGPFWGTLWLGLLWSLWHLPDFLTASKGGGEGTGLSTFLMNFPIFTLAVVSLAFILTWIYNNTNGSLFTAVLAHAGVNTPELVIFPLFPAVTMIGIHIGGLIAFFPLALLVIILTRGRLGYASADL
jgi:membrane protease YdiL (CAAX protease family)